MEYLAVLLEKHAGARALFGGEFSDLIVVVGLAGLLIFRSRNLIVVVEIAAEGRHPFKLPSHAFLEGFDLGIRRARDDDKCCVALGDVNADAIEGVGQKRAAWASLFPSGAKHEVIDDELAATV